MQINELIENRLIEKFPGKTIKMQMEVDPIRFIPFSRLVVNGQQTNFGFDLESFLDNGAISGKSYEDFANDFSAQFVQNVVSGLELGHSL